jgi:hypothetical protein
MSAPVLDVTEMWPNLPSDGAKSFSFEMDGPVLGVLNVDAAIDYARLDAPIPARAASHPIVLALFDAMKSAGMRCSIEFNKRFFEIDMSESISVKAPALALDEHNNPIDRAARAPVTTIAVLSACPAAAEAEESPFAAMKRWSEVRQASSRR